MNYIIDWDGPGERDRDQPTPEEEKAEAWEYWHQRAVKLERELHEARAERNELYGYVNGLLGLLQLLRGRDDITNEVKEIMRTNHRAVDAAAYLTQIVPPIERP